MKIAYCLAGHTREFDKTISGPNNCMRNKEGVDFFMNIIDSIDLSTATSSGGTAGGLKTISPIIKTIMDNNGQNGDINMGKTTNQMITLSKAL